ncbi:MAG: GNAT family N-acetyltransferase [Eubacteriales bacterium]|nr:GNAT family N-acetyltransferase [Eubacteriales bacterium]
MLDKSVPHKFVFMEKSDPAVYPRYDLPPGYSFCLFHPGLEQDWKSIHREVGHFDDDAAAQRALAADFLPHPALMARQMLFVCHDASGQTVGTASLWPGEEFGRTRQRLHWVAVRPAHSGRGIAKALLTRLLDIYAQQGYTDGVYLITQTWSWRAVNLYRSFGFQPYLGPRPAGWQVGNFDADTPQAWQIIDAALRTSQG